MKIFVVEGRPSEDGKRSEIDDVKLEIPSRMGGITDPLLWMHETKEAVRLLAFVIRVMDSGPSYWGDDFSKADFTRIVKFLAEYGINLVDDEE